MLAVGLDKDDEMPDDTAEIIRMLREAEKRSAANATQADLQNVSNSLMGGLREVGGRIDTLAATVNNHAVVIDQLGQRVAIVEKTAIAKPASLIPRRMSPSPMPAYDPEKTEGGRRIVPADKWNEFETTLKVHAAALEQLEEERDKAKEAEKRAQERQADIAEYAASLELKAKKSKKRITKIIGALVAAGPVIGTAVHYLLEYLHNVH
jgi:hypothetical protein